MKGTVAVTGSSGFIARHLIPSLLESGSKVQGLDIREPDVDFGADFGFVLGDIRDRQSVRQALDGAESIIHLAAEHHDFGVKADDYYSVNVDGIATLLDVAEAVGIQDFCSFSSVAVYGSLPGESSESTRPDPVNHYGKSKLQAEERLSEWAKRSPERRAVNVRPTVVYGEHNRENMYRLAKAVASGRYIQVGAGENRKSIVYVGNVIAAVRFIMEVAAKGTTTVNLSDEPALSSRVLAETIAAMLGRQISSLVIPRWLALPLATPLDWIAALTGANLPITRSRIEKYLSDTLHSAGKLADLGFQPPFTTEAGLTNTIEWYRAEGLIA